VLWKTSRVFSLLNSNGAVLLEPPKKIDKTFYICDKQFYLDPILEMFKDEMKLGIVLIAGDSFEMYIITKTGNHYEHQKIYSDDVMPIKRHRKGGQSSVRFARLADEKEEAYIKMVGEITVKYFMKDNNTQSLVEKLIIAGPSNKKNYLKDDQLIQQYFKSNLVIMNTAELNDQTIYDTLIESHKYFDEENDKYYNSILDKLQEMMTFADERLLIGVDELLIAVKENMVKEIYVSDEINDLFEEIELNKCEKITIPSSYTNKIGINAFGIKWY
ncbi:peptide chain release factor eRF1/aRF1, partial [Fadolivirus algeromassiliense]